jgi:hypothetical protein
MSENTFLEPEQARLADVRQRLGSKIAPLAVGHKKLAGGQTQSSAIRELEGATKRETLADQMPVVRSEVQILQSQALAKTVAADLNLAANPEFNPSLRPATKMAEGMDWLAGKLPPWRANRPRQPDSSPSRSRSRRMSSRTSWSPRCSAISPSSGLILAFRKVAPSRR